MKAHDTKIIELQQKIIFWKNEPECEAQKVMLARYRKEIFKMRKELKNDNV